MQVVLFKTKPVFINTVPCSSVSQSCPTLCNPMDCSMPGPLSVTNSQSLPKIMSTEMVMPSNHKHNTKQN